MPAAEPTENEKEENGVPAKATNGSSADIIALVSSSEIFQQLLQIDVENKRLKERNAALEVTNNTNLDTIFEKRDAWFAEKAALERALQSERDEIETLREVKAQADKLSQEIMEMEGQIVAQIETITNKGIEIGRHQALCEEAKEELEREKAIAKVVSDSLMATKHELSCRKKDLETANESLAEIQSFIAPLQPLSKKKAQIQDALGSIFRKFLDFFATEFGGDVKPGTTTADTMAGHFSPLPTSSSAAAKQMRIAAALRISGWALIQHVFRQPLVDDDLGGALKNVAMLNPDQAAYVRAILLQVHKLLPEDEQKQLTDSGVEAAVEGITAALGKLMPRAIAGLAPKLKPLCEAAAETWNLTLGIENNIETQFSFDVADDWRIVPLGETNQKQPPSDAAAGNGDGNDNDNDTPPTLPEQQQPQESLLSEADVLRVVWPAFTAHVLEDDGPTEIELVSCGYVLTHAQAKEAKDEAAREDTACKQARQDIRRQSSAGGKKKRSSSVVVRTVSIASNGG